MTRRLEELSGNDEDEDDGCGEPGCPTLPEEEPLLGRLHLTGGMRECLVELESLGFERARELAGLHSLALAELLEEVALEVGHLAEKLDERVVARDIGGVAVGDGGARLTLLRAAAILGLEEGPAGRAEEGAGLSAGAADRAT